MRILAMDTVGHQGSVALLDDNTPITSAMLTEPTGHVVTLPKTITSLLKKAGWCIEDIDLVAVTLGPGSFTGLRIALGVAKGLVLGQDVNVVGISTLDVVAAGSGAKKSGDLVATILDARRKEIYFGLYKLSAYCLPEAINEPFIADPLSLSQELAADPSIISTTQLFMNGSGLGPYNTLFKEALGERFKPTPEEGWNPDPFLLGKLALHKFTLHGGDSGASLNPLYLRRPDAVIKKMVL
ncbi:MAG: tRNA (adenosine(37)-N6)-threonylcarbamoyltransferase complex dimerization subunit type 1 TsaB [Magnetococcales bacterium]|nr:tRNA (adenosine(37)-N6)-threonylcarbamoyltransferase complex dimerization subunit type 1 TsaB [Magnetococcales bacterium]